MIGRHLLHYRIVALLGSGGMGEVYLAIDEKLGREVAIKILPSPEGDEGEKLRQEARALAALSHPNIVTIHAAEEAEDRPFLVMERIEGVSLKSRITPGGLEADDFFAIALPLTDAIAAAHERGILHRDLKPANVLITRQGHLKVLDFGLARQEKAAGSAPADPLPDPDPEGEASIFGTLPYLAPEVIEKRQVSPRSDVFSLGVLLHELATGYRPFHGETVAGLMIAIVCHRLAPARYEASLPETLPAVIERCLAADPGERFANARELHQELYRLRGPGLAALEAQRSRRSWRGRLLASVVAAAVVGGALLAAGGFLSRAPAPPSPPPPPTANLEAYQAFLRGRDAAWLITNLETASRATVLLERAAQLDPQFLSAWCELATTHAQIFHFGLDRSSARADQAMAALERARALAPEAQEVHRAAGFVLYWTRRDYQAALAELGRAIELSPDDARAREGRAFIERRRGHMNEAMEDMRKVVELDPNDGRAWRELGVTATYLRRYDEAVEAFDRAIQLSPDPTMAYLSQTRVQWMRGDFEAARRRLSARPPLEQDLPHFHAFWQEVYDGRFEAALAELDQVRAPFFSWSTVYTPVASLRAMVLVWQGKAAAAVQQFELSLAQIDELLGRQLDDPRLHALRAQALIGLGRRDEAKQELDKAQELARSGDFIAAAETQFEVIVAWVELGEWDAAFAGLEKQLAEPSNLISPPILARDPRFERLRQDPRFSALTRDATPTGS